MAEWEHKIVIAGRTRVPKFWNPDRAETTLEAEGNGGWELVSAVPRPEGDTGIVWLIFKRPSTKDAGSAQKWLDALEETKSGKHADFGGLAPTETEGDHPGAK